MRAMVGKGIQHLFAHSKSYAGAPETRVVAWIAWKWEVGLDGEDGFGD